jgi:pyruvate dehydrogenase E2 component (dihydrolipoamide acetyltransferase)
MIEFRLPSLGADMDEGKLLEWRVQPGDAVKKGQIVCVVDTAKAAIDVECWHDGIVQQLLVEPGATIPVGTPMALLREPGEAAAGGAGVGGAAGAAAAGGAAAAAAEAAAPTETAAAPPAGAAASTLTGAPPSTAAAGMPPPAAGPLAAEAAAVAAPRRISPAARKRAAELGVDLATVAPGADGVVSLADVERAAQPSRQAAATPAAATMAERAAQMRRVIAAAMARSKREIPHYYLAEDVPLLAAHAWLAQANAARPLAARLLLAPLLLRSVALALRRYPELNGYYRDGAFAAGDGIHIGVAISLRAGGLVTPALLDVDRKDIDTVNRELLDLVRRARAGSLRAAELAAGTITVTSLGDQGVTAVYGVIYPPQVAIVGFGRVAERPWAVDGALRVAPVVTATLAADHRVSDGHRGGLFLAAVRDLLQNPAELNRPSP